MPANCLQHFIQSYQVNIVPLRFILQGLYALLHKGRVLFGKEWFLAGLGVYIQARQRRFHYSYS